LSVYAAGVFILLSMTGWAVTKRLVRDIWEEFSVSKVALIVGAFLAATLTTGATGIIFVERFAEGAWTYLIFIPLLYATFTYFRNQLGAPSKEMDYLGQLDAAQLAGFGFGQYETATKTTVEAVARPSEVKWQPDPIERSKWRQERVGINRLVVLLDGSIFAAQAIPAAKSVASATGAQITLLSSVKDHTPSLQTQYEDARRGRELYLRGVAEELILQGFNVDYSIRPGHITDATQQLIREDGIDLVVTTTRGKSGTQHWIQGGVSRKLLQKICIPVLLVHDTDEENGAVPKIDRILIALDGSINSERVLPYARVLAKAYKSELILVTVPAVPEVKNYRAAAEIVETIRAKAEVDMRKFLEAVARSLRDDGINVRTIVSGSIPAQTIVQVSEEEDADMIMLTSMGRGGMDLVMMGSVAQRVVQITPDPIFMMPILVQAGGDGSVDQATPCEENQ